VAGCQRVESPHSKRTHTHSRGSCKGWREHGNHGISQNLALATSLRTATCYLPWVKFQLTSSHRNKIKREEEKEKKAYARNQDPGQNRQVETIYHRLSTIDIQTSAIPRSYHSSGGAHEPGIKKMVSCRLARLCHSLVSSRSDRLGYRLPVFQSRVRAGWVGGPGWVGSEDE
jgi:hypothetical protein